MNNSKELAKFSLSYLKDIFKAQPALIITILYLYLSLIGLVYAISFFGEFKIKIIDYFSLADFLLITVSNPQVFLYGLLIILMFLLLKTRIYSGLRESIINPPVYQNKILNRIFKPIFFLSKIIFYPVINLKIMMIIVILSPILISLSSAKKQSHLFLNKEIKSISYAQRDNNLLIDITSLIMGLRPKDYTKVRLSHDAFDKDVLKKLDGKYIILMTTNNYLILWEEKNKRIFAVLRAKVSVIYYDYPKN